LAGRPPVRDPGLRRGVLLAYGLGAATFRAADALWAIVALTVLISIAVHGVSAAPAMTVVGRAHRRRGPTGPDGPGDAGPMLLETIDIRSVWTSSPAWG
jgi:hypothetical protein